MSLLLYGELKTMRCPLCMSPVQREGLDDTHDSKESIYVLHPPPKIKKRKENRKVMRKVQTKPHAGVEMFIFVR